MLQRMGSGKQNDKNKEETDTEMQGENKKKEEKRREGGCVYGGGMKRKI